MAFGNEIKSASIVENWLFEIAGTSSLTLRFAFADCTVSGEFYHGVILNNPSIRESINLKNSTSQTSNMSIDIPDFQYQGSLISEILYGGSSYFINRVVTIKSIVNNASPNTIGSFRLTNISRTIETISLEMASHRPWDFVDFPPIKTSRNNYTPVAYGVFTKNPNTSYSSPQFESALDGVLYYPCPYEQSRSGRQEFSVAIIDRSTDAELAFYDKGLDIFIPFTTPISNTFARLSSNYVSTTEKYFRRGFKYRADGHIDENGAWEDEAKAYNTNTADFAKFEATVPLNNDNGGAVSVSKNDTGIDFTFPKPDGKLNNAVIKIELNINTLHGNNFTSSDDFNLRVYVDWDGGTNYGDALFHTTANLVNESVTLSKTFTIEDSASFPDTIKLAVQYNATDDANFGSAGSQWTQVVKVHIKDVNVTAEAITEEADIDFAYVGADGLPATGWGSGNAITEIHEAHRDILYRFADMTVTSGNIDGWTSLNSAKDWKVRYWKYELTPLKDVLEKLQYEGGFIFRFKQGNTATPQYIHIKDSYSSSDIDYTITKNDIKSAVFNITPLPDLVTQMNINYRKHPTNKRYGLKKTASSTTARTNYNINSKENVLDINLDAYVNPVITEYDGSTLVENANSNDNFFSYYYNVLGVPRIEVTANMINPKFYNLDIGDLVDFSNMYPVKAFNQSYTNKVFMITSVDRKVGNLKFKAREVGVIS
tara:strand:+ start:810 stop:2942 length:2133 start_codon:yes stop_codon:yes gene_type:complete